MGKQRYYWSGNGRTPSTSNTTLLHHQPSSSSSSSTSAGCMCAVFQLFDFHPLNQHHHHHPPQSSVSLKPIAPPLDHDHDHDHDHDYISKGTEAPRNSLESEDEESPLSCTPKQKDEGLHFPNGIVKIKTKSGIKRSPPNKENYVSGNSPSTKTPTLVARLMGLDLLPQSNDSPSTTPKSASSPLVLKPKTTNIHSMAGGSRSLPETPRTSCERKSNVEINYHHRLSLQIPNNCDKENSSPSHYAKEIVKQIKETVSRKVGLNDITNYTRRDQEVIPQTKPKKVLSCSSSSPKNNSKKSSPNVEAIGTNKPKQKKVKTKVASKKKEEPFVVPARITKATIDGLVNLKKSKKTPLSNQLLSFGSVPTTILMKKEPSFSSPIKPTPPMQSPCNRIQAADETGDDDKESKRSNHQPHIPIIHHHQHVIQLPHFNINNKVSNFRTTAVAAANCRNNHHDITAELEYVRQILLRRTTTTTSSSSVLSVFLEYNNNNNNISIPHRKLLCHLVEEFLKPYVEIRPYRPPSAAAEWWPEVVEKLCEKVRKLPRAKCEVLEDIDGIIEKDMDILGIGFEEESEGIVKEIEELIVEELLNETVRFVDEVRDRDGRKITWVMPPG